MSFSSPCRRRATGSRRHHCSWWHASLVESYQEARRVQEAQAEAATSGYATELAEYWERNPPLRFRDWLTNWERDR